MRSFRPRPQAKIQHDARPKLKAANPHLLHAVRYTRGIVFKVLRRWIVTVEPAHPLIMAEPDGVLLPLQLPRERRLADTEETVKQMGFGLRHDVPGKPGQQLSP